ncbi:MAG: multiheme c-type cytochrome [Candidatus Latescibacterota bacterium]
MTALKRITCLIISGCLALVFTACGKSEAPHNNTLTVAFSNDMVGEIRSCGCKTNDFGGLGRQATLVTMMADTSSNFLLLEGGDFFGSEINYGKEKADITMKSMAIMGYHGVVIGETDLGFGIEYLVLRSKQIGVPILAANLFDANADTLFFAASRQITTNGGLRVQLIGVMGSNLKLPPQVPPGSVRISDPVEAVRSELEAMDEAVDLVVVLAHMDRKDAFTIAQQLSRVDLIALGHEGRPMRKMRRIGNAFLLQAAKEGKYIGHAFCTLDADKRIETVTAEMVALDTGYPDDERVAKLFTAYDMHIREKAKSGEPIGMITAGQELNKPYAGAEKCRDCHSDIFQGWQATSHALAFDTLVRNAREFDRDCTPCHTTGFYKLGGYSTLQVTPELTDVQCEACHGNGYDHLQNNEVAPEGKPSAICISCHNDEWTPGFSFEESWAKIRH